MKCGFENFFIPSSGILFQCSIVKFIKKYVYGHDMCFQNGFGIITRKGYD